MGGWLRQMVLNAQVRAGLSADIAIWALVAAIALPIALVFFLIAADVWLAARYGSVWAGLILAGAFLAVALVAILALLMARRRNIERARLELEVRKSASPGLLDPKLMAVGYQIGEKVGWRRVASVAAVGFLAAAVAREWMVHRQESAHEDESDGPDS
jgi:type VI protein secretion system component VasK